MVSLKSSILGPDGQPFERKLLSQEMATPTVAGVRRVHEERVATLLTPERLGTILRDASEGNGRAYLTLAEEMEERYLHYASQVQTRRLAIESVDMTLEAPKEIPSKIIDAVKELIGDPAFLDAIGSLSDGITKSYSVAEMMWEYERKALRPVEYKWRDQRFFQFDKLSLTDLRLSVDGSTEGEQLPYAKYLRHLPRTKMGIPLRRGLARPAAWAFMIQSFGLQDWAGFSEVYGMPLRVGKYHPQASESDKRTLLRAVTSIANDAAAIIPDGMSIDFHEVSGSRGEAVFGGLLSYVDKQVSKLVVGQTMTSDDGSSLGQAKIHNEVRLDILRADCRQLANTATRDLIKPFIIMNFGVQDIYPRAEMIVPDPEDLTALVKGVTSLVPFGMRVSEREMREKFGLSDPSDEDLLLIAPKSSPVQTNEDLPGGQPSTTKQPAHAKPPVKDQTATLAAKMTGHASSCGCASCLTALAAGRDQDALDDVDQLFAALDDEWEVISTPIMEPLFEIIESASTFEEALLMLEAKGPNAAKLGNRLAELMAISRGIGDVKD